MNNDFKVIDDTLYSGVAAEDIIQRRKSPVIALIVALAGSALAVWSLTSDTMVDRGNLSSMLMLVGERIRRYEIYYQAADKPALCAAVSSGDMERLVNIPRNDKSSSLLLTLYATESGSFSMGQVSQYVPHAFEPVTDVVRFSAEQGKLAVGLV